MANSDQPRVFTDAVILIRGSSFPRFPFEVLRLASEGKIIIVATPSVLADARFYLDELYPDGRKRLENFLTTVSVEIVDDPSRQDIVANRGLTRDPRDVEVALAAINARVDYLISTDTDLTDLDATTEEMRARLAPGQVMKPGEFLDRVMGWTHDQLEAISRRRWEDLK